MYDRAEWEASRMVEDVRADLAELRAEVAAKPGRDWFIAGLVGVCAVQALILVIALPPLVADGVDRFAPTQAQQEAEAAAIDRLATRIKELETALAVEVAETEQFFELDTVHPIIRRMLPTQLLEALLRGNLLHHVTATDFGGEEWLFIDQSVFREFSPDEQQSIAEAARQGGVRFMVK
ncbi:MAG: hypothetical protein AAF713_15485 [Pseudomonadota bacterium]